MPPSPKRAISVSITDFSPAEQRLLRAAFHAFVPFVLVGGMEEGNAKVIALGHPDGLAPPTGYPAGARIYGMVRIKGVDKQPEEVRLPVPVKGTRR
jgi:hypothetical protein